MKGSTEEFCLYVHTAPNGKKYVGITSKKPEDRWQNGRGYRGTYFARAIQKYGWENFKHEVLFSDLSKEEAIRMEREYIQKYDTTNRNKGYNRSLGGEVPANDMADREEYRLSQSLKAHRQWNRGEGKTPHTATPHITESKYRKRVLQYDADGNLIAMYESVKACAKALGVSPMPVSETCNGKAKTCKGYILRFENETFLSDGIRGSWQARPVIQMDLERNIIKRFDSATDASKAFGRSSPCTILDACKGNQITAYGYRWCFA